MSESFYPKNKKLVNKNIEKLLKNNFLDHRFCNLIDIDAISSLDTYKPNSVIFLKNIFNKFDNQDCHIITSNSDLYKNDKYLNITLVKDLNHSYNTIVNHIYHHEDSLGYYDEFKFINNSHISIYSDIDPSTLIFNNCVIGRGVKIGKNCIIKNNVVIKNSYIGNDVIICDNTTIGSTGFGFDLKKMGSKNLNPQIGSVIIEDGVYIGSNCAIDRGKIDSTLIGKNSMLDNQIHIAHNVHLGENACIAAQSGISGSTKIGKNLIAGGQSGFAGHLEIGDNVVVAAKSGVTKNIVSNSFIAGFPAIDINKWKKMMINLKKYGH